MNSYGGAWPRSKMHARSSPTRTPFTLGRESRIRRWCRVRTHDSARPVSKPGSLSPQHKFRARTPSLTLRDAKGSQLCDSSVEANSVLADESHNCEPLASRSVRLGVRARNLCCGLSEPGFETGLAESCVLTRHQRLIRDSRPRVKGVRVGDDLAWIFERGQAPPYEFIDAKLFRPPDFDDAVHRRA